MKIQNILADEVIQLGLGILAPEFVEVETIARAQVLEAGHVADRRVEPDVEILARRVGDLEAEIGRVARDVPVLQPRVEPLVELVGDLGLHVHVAVVLVLARKQPHPQEVLEIAELEKEVLRFLLHWRHAGEHRHRILQLGRRVRGAAVLARVAVLVGRAAARAGALDEAVG